VGSLNISQSNNPVCLGGHFTRVELLEVIGLSGFRCYARAICRVDTSVFSRCIFFGSFVLQDMY